ncbi:feruloyl-CoA synthase [Desertibaculum subflavum]|uniref:feruloyl-CoA synthase n=1 Tax=Desertibaculum subflavum TaxID=2268458 RepID=UPI000E669081
MSVPLRLLAPRIEVERRPDGSLVLTSPEPLAEHPPTVGSLLAHWAREAPQRLFLAERVGGAWRKLTYGEAARQSARIAAALLARGLGPERPVLSLSANAVDLALLKLACQRIGVPFVPVSPAYSLMSRDHAKVVAIVDLIRPGLIYVADGPPFASALAALDLEGVEVVTSGAPPAGIAATPFGALAETAPGPEVAAAEARVGPDSIAKILFTSGSTGMPKGVVNTQRMLMVNQQQLLHCWPFLDEAPPVLLDWLPWHHTFGGNYNFNLVLRHGGEFWIDEGRPAPGLIERTAANLREVSPTVYFNVPAGFGALLPFLESDAGLAEGFFRRLRIIMYAGAALPADLWARLEAVSLKAVGRKVPMTSCWGSTETAPLATSAHFPIDRAGVIGLPVPGVAVKMVPSGGKLELRVKGPSVFPGYFRRPDLTETSFDEEGFYRMGDAGRFADPDDPAKGIVFDGRVTEDFKLATGTWVNVGAVRVAALAAASPLLQDAVVCGHDRGVVALLAWPNIAACRSVAGLAADAPVETVLAATAVRDHLKRGLAAYNQANPGSSTRIARLLLMAEPPSIDGNEITDKGYINQRATLERRAALVEKLYCDPLVADVIAID